VTVVPEEQKEEVLETIISSARSSEEGAVGDGKIFVSAVSEVVRVRTRERDMDALTTSNGE
jgi:nitrogen regulatory protein PII